MRANPIRNQSGFTMIEMIVSMILIGIMATVAGMGLVAITKGYVFARQNNETSLKAQVALAKIAKEIGIPDVKTFTITTATATAINFSYTDPVDAAVKNRTIALSGTQILFDGITLVDSVSSLNIDYYDCCNATALTKPVSAANLLRIRRVEINLSLTGADNVVSAFNKNIKVQETYY